MVALSIAAEPSPPDYVHASAIDPGALDDLYGPFSSRRQARETLRAVAGEAALCWTMLGLERRQGPCFARQVRKCAGACVGAETPVAHHARLRDALAPYALQRWPYPDAVGVRESSLTGERAEVHLFRDWCWLATVRDDSELAAVLDAPPRGEFDLDIYRLLARRLPRARLIPLRTSRVGLTEANAATASRATSLETTPDDW
jgi:DNA polymerase-3 subunit epsilon